jgi:hypothetical protein
MLTKYLLLFVFVHLFVFLMPVSADEVLTNASVIEMVKVGLATDLIVQQIKEAANVNFDVTASGMVALKKANVPDDVIRAMKTRQSGSAPAAPAVSTASPNKPVNTPEPSTGGQTSVQQFPDAHYLVKAPGQDKAQPIKGVFVLDPTARVLRFQSTGSTQVEIPYSSMTNVIYEKTAKPRYGWGLVVAWPLLFTKSKNHYVTVQYNTPAGQGDFAIFRLDKKNFRVALATIEAQTGKKVERTQEN